MFVTAHHQHAVAAFEKQAVDYVLKPFSNNRIHEALDTAIRRTESERAAQFVKILPQLEELLSKSAKIAIKTKGRILFVDPADVVTIEAQGNYVLLQRASGSYLLRESISTTAEKLKACGFIRIIQAYYGALANTGRNTVLTPPTNNFDATAIKRFVITERYKVEFGVQAFSLLNHPQFIPCCAAGAGPGALGGATNAVTAQGVTGSARNALEPQRGIFNNFSAVFPSEARALQLSLKIFF